MLTTWLVFWSLCSYASVNFQEPQASHPPPPSLGLLRDIFPPCLSRGWGISKFAVGHLPFLVPHPPPLTNPSLTYVVAYPNIVTQRILLEKQADWFICQGREKIVKGCKGMFSILCIHFFIAYRRWLLNQISVAFDTIWRKSFHSYKTIQNR